MYLHLGLERIVRSGDIIGIFDLDSTTVSRHTRRFLYLAEKGGDVVTVSAELPKAFVLCKAKKEKRSRIYISQISPATLLKRMALENPDKEKRNE